MGLLTMYARAKYGGTEAAVMQQCGRKMGPETPMAWTCYDEAPLLLKWNEEPDQALQVNTHVNRLLPDREKSPTAGGGAALLFILRDNFGRSRIGAHQSKAAALTNVDLVMHVSFITIAK